MNAQDYDSLLADPSPLRAVIKSTGVYCRLDQRQPKQYERQRRIWIKGSQSAVESASRTLLEQFPNPNDPLSKRHDNVARLGPIVVVQPDSTKVSEHKTRMINLTNSETMYAHLLNDSVLEDIRQECKLESIVLAPNPASPNHLALHVIASPHAFAHAKEMVSKFLATGREVSLKDRFKTAMRSIAAPVAIITAVARSTPAKQDMSDDQKTSDQHEAEQQGPDRISSFRGMTISSFTAVCLAPNPVVSFNIRTPSRTLDALRNSRTFFINIPAANDIGRAIANAFTKPHDDPSLPFRQLYAERGTQTRSKQGGPPYILGMGIQARYKCQLLSTKTVEIGDHVVLFAEVVKVEFNKQLFERNDSILGAVAKRGSNAPTSLLYAHGEYMRAAATITEGESRESNTSETAQEQDLEDGPEEDEYQQLAKLNGMYFASAHEDELPLDDLPQPDLLPLANKDDTSRTAAYNSFPTSTPSSSRHFSTLQRPSAYPASMTTRRSMSTSTNTDAIDAELLATKVSDYVFQPFDESGNYKKSLRRLPTRLQQRQTLESALLRLDEARKSGDLDDESFEAAFTRGMRLRTDVMENRLDVDELRVFLQEFDGERGGQGSLRLRMIPVR